ncbi:HPr kinase/phosphorylase [Sphingomonas yabuuchiae]|uniref:HPr kinase/phosphatase C-terminal domain-containing protein n=1 Tax=Sphingomonas yabuuchiae TaxID=172044 RepID=A0AA41A2G9_9SPHN|nr:HPr kinase/phosphatase C-terminal domain-containing protein [Sphingomonas yabuuchiae]MBB4608606.1 serine kinase of HPr protein (carbohydrate metabolism regulator) [Sphingomonas yabuuchiae]MBN3558923.1 HPr kinase/phosphatase C-terminal domain-containing protein [Sphingomonas yabuuchiae]
MCELIHATCVTIGGTGVMLRGPSGTGKSDLALRLIDRGAVLIGDDYVEAAARDGTLHVTVPERIAGLIEVRGVGILPFPYRASATIGLVVELHVDSDAEERLPEARQTVIAGVSLPIYRLNPRPASAPIKVELLASRLKECP